MTDPEVEYRRLVSGDAAAVRDAVDTLRWAAERIDGAREDIDAAAGVPVWTGTAATAFGTRVAGLSQGAALTSSIVIRARGALETAATAYDACVANADHYISFWRNRPLVLPAVFEELLARQVNAGLLDVGTSYNEQLTAITAVLDGDEVDLDELDEDTREWVEQGLERNKDWREGNDSGLGPMIPNTAATGDDRGWIPQGLGYDAATRSLLQAYDTEGGEAGLAVIDEVTGKEVGEVQLGGDYYDDNGMLVPSGSSPTHAGGVAVDGDNVYVTDNGKVFTYSLSEIRDQTPGATVPQSAEPQSVDGGSYTAYRDGRLYSGDFENNELHVYEKDSSGSWVKVETVETPAECQGVVVRDGEYVFSTSYGRHNESSLIAQDRWTGERGDSYPLPNMSEGLVEVDGELVTSYESGAEKYSESGTGALGWLWGVPDGDSLWANPYMTRTPLSELGLSEDFEVEPSTLTRAAGDLDAPASALVTSASTLDGVTVPASALGPVPAAADLSRSVTALLAGGASSLRTGANAVRLTGDVLVATGKEYEATDGAVGGRFNEMTPG
ncbi:MAG: hypothetical protein WKF79_10350 [Nocardioides sp.]